MQIEYNGELYDVAINSAGDAFDTISWTRKSDGTELHLVVSKLKEDAGLGQLCDHLAWKLRFPWKSETTIAFSERLLEVDDEGVEFKIGLSKTGMKHWNPDESKMREPKIALSARSKTRAAVLQEPALKPRMSGYTDDELRELWRTYKRESESEGESESR